MLPESAAELRIMPVCGVPEIRAGDLLGDQLAEAIRANGPALLPGDVLVVTQKVVSKAEGCAVDLESVKVSATTSRWAGRYGHDPRVIQLAIDQSKRIVRKRNGVLITETQHGFVCATSGIDVSNVDGGRTALLLPRDPDASAQNISMFLRQHFAIDVPVIIADTFGRPWREGLTEVAIGVFGMKTIRSYRGKQDPHGYRLQVTLEAVADELASAAGLAGSKLSRTPACVIRGFPYEPSVDARASDLIRPAERDLFR